MRIFCPKFIGLMFFFCFSSAFAAQSTHLSQKQEQRAQELFLQVRCPVCAGQTIEGSDTSASLELKKIIRQQILQGKSDKQIKIWLIENYGDEILNSPPDNTKGLILWILPILFFLLVVFVVCLKFFKNRRD